MARLIDADALMRKCSCKRNCSDCDFYTDGDSWCKGEVFGITIMQMPTIDAVPVVRCKDCKHWHKDTVFCGYMSYGEASERVNWYADDFCSYGERKDGDK